MLRCKTIKDCDEEAAKQKCEPLVDENGIFGECIRNLPENAKQFFNNCVLDTCVITGDESAVCATMQAFAEVCRINGSEINDFNNILAEKYDCNRRKDES